MVHSTPGPLDTRRLSPAAFPYYVLLATAAFVINAWVGTGVSPLATTRTLAVALGTAAVLILVIGLAWGRNFQRAGLVVGGIALAMSGIHADVLGMAERIGGWQGTVWTIAVVGAALMGLRLAWRSVRGRGGLERATRRLNILGALFLVVVTISALLDGAVAIAVEELSWTASYQPEEPSAAHPDIYLLLLDGYPRADTLEQRFGYDNSPFLTDLRQREFNVAPQSRTNYMFTQLVLLSLLHMQHADDIQLEPPIDSVARMNRSVRQAINQAPAFDILRHKGYSVVTSSPGYESVVIRNADVFMESDALNEFERHLLRRTILMDGLGILAPDWLPSHHRELVTSHFEHLREVAATPSSGPRFMLVHVPAPHTPHVFQADGSPVRVHDQRAFYGDTPELMKVTRSEFQEVVRGQIEYLNQEVIEAVDYLMDTSDQPPVIIVMSDHGTRMDVTYGNLADPDIDERMNNFFAAYTPTLELPFGDGITPVNVLPILFNAYLNTDLPCQPDDSFVTGADNLLDLHPLPPPTRGSDPACGHLSEDAER